MSTDVGAIIGYLRLDGTQFRQEIASAVVELKALSGQTVDIKVKDDALTSLPGKARTAAASLDGLGRAERAVQDATERVNVAQSRLSELQQSGTAKTSALANAEAALTRARRAEQDAVMLTYAGNLKLADSQDKAAKGADKNRQSVGLLISAITLLGPALVPVALGTAGLAIGFAGMGAAGIAAIMGIKNEMAQGTAVGQQYAGGLAQLQGGLQRIEAIAARNILGSFQHAVATISAQVPTLTQDIGQLATITGKTASAVLDGLVKAFMSLAPYMAVAATDILNFVTNLAPLGGNNGLKVFAQAAVAELPKVLQLVGQLLDLSVKLLASMLPFGTVILNALQMFVGAINNIPIGVLTALAQLALSVFAGFKAWESITGIVEGVVATLKGLNSTLEISEGVLSSAAMAASIIGIAVAAFSLILAHNAQAAEEATARQESYAESVRASNGAIDEGVRAQAAKNLESDKALQAADALGMSLSLVTSAAVGQKDALTSVIGTLDQMIKTGTRTTYSTYGTTTSMNDQAKSAQLLKDSILQQNGALGAAIRQQQAVSTASKVTNGVMTAQEKATASLAASYGMSVPTYEAAVKAQQSTAQSLAATTAKMQLENDAAGLLKAALDQLNGKTITAAQAQQQFDQSLVNMGNHATAAGGKVKNTTHDINGMSAGSVQLRGELINQVTAMESVIQAHGGLKNSTAASRAEMARLRDQIINNAVAHGIDRKAVTDYIDKLFQIPKSIPPTKLDVNNAAALAKINAVRAAMDAISGKVATTFVNTVATTINAIGQSVAKSAHFHGGIQFREGGIHDPVGFQSFADGKLPSQAMIAPDGANLVQWAETGTGGEAFIPLGPSNRARSLAIWEETGRRLGASAKGSSQSLAGIEISGTLDTPWGPSQIRGVVKSELASAAAESRLNDRLRNGVNR